MSRPPGDGNPSSETDPTARQRALIAAEALCAARGEGLNEPGRRVLKVLLAAPRPLKAYDLTYALATGGRSAAPPTVYRALKFLIGMELAHRIESQNAYVACRFPGEPHFAGFHVCERCGAANEFKLQDIPSLAGPGDRLVFEVLRTCSACD